MPRLENMRDNSEKEHFLEPGVHLARFALRPIFQRGFEILVRKDVGYLLPTIPLLGSKLEHWQLQILQHMNNWTVATCCERLRGRSLFVNEQEQQFVRQLFEAITCLANKIDRSFFQDARLVAHPLHAPAASYSGGQAQQGAFMIAFRIIADAYQESSLNDDFEFAPSKFFLVQQHAYQNCADNEIFARRIHREFAALAECCESPGPVSRTYSRYSFNRTEPRLRSVRRRPRSLSPRKTRWSPRKHSIGHGLVDDNASEIWSILVARITSVAFTCQTRYTLMSRRSAHWGIPLQMSS